MEFSLKQAIQRNPDPQRQVVLGANERGQPVYVSDHERSMHVQVLGQTGAGKSRGVIEPLLFQDLYRGRGVLIVDGKGAQESVERLCAMAAVAGRLPEREIEHGRIVAFYLPSNYYKQLARYIGISVFQHLQQIGALRQLDRTKSQEPLYVFADEFYSFAYEGFTDAVNKLRDANISILLSHQSFSDLEKVSKEYAAGIWDNTRTKIVLYQNDREVCDRLADALGTEKQVALTVRRSADAFLNAYSTLEASSKEVDAYRLHPNRIKQLRCGQAYLAQGPYFTGVNLSELPDFPAAIPPAPRADSGSGIGLYAEFLKKPGAARRGGQAAGG